MQIARIAVVVAAALVSITALVSTCTPPPKPQPPLVLDNVPARGEVRCGPVTKTSELIGGPQAFAQVGRSFRCNNHNVRFIVQDASRPVGTSAEGGNIIDADLARDDGSGEDTFREHVSAIGAKENHVEKIEVVKDGRDGGDGIIRVTGTPTNLSLAPQAYYLSQDLKGTLVTDYVLHPDVNYVEIKTTFKNASSPLPSVQPADFIAFGGANKVHTPENGFGDVPLFSSVSVLQGVRGDKVSYAIVSPDADIVIPFADQGNTAPFYGTGVPVGSEHDFLRYFLIGDGSIDSTESLALQLRNLPRGTISGVVKDASGAPAANVLVAAMNASLTDPSKNAHVVNEARTKQDGTYTMTIAPGSYTLIAHAAHDDDGRARSPEVTVSVDDKGSATAEALTIGARGHVHASTIFQNALGIEQPTKFPSKLTLVAGDDAQKASDVLAEFSQNGAASYAVSNNGVFDVDVPPGHYTAYVSRGFEWERSQQDIVVTANETTNITAIIKHVVDTDGLIASEFHQHCLGSIDAQVPVPRKVLENAAEGIEFAASTDHDIVTDFAPYLDQMGLRPFLNVIPGDEVSYQGIGHFNVYPMPVDDADPFANDGSRLWWMKTVPEMFKTMRDIAGDPIIQINHPRAQLTGYFASLTLNPVDGTRIPKDPPNIPTLPAAIYSDWAGDFDAMEVNGNLGDVNLYTDAGRDQLALLAHNDATNVPVLSDYFALLGAGMKIVAMGNSDTHHLDEGVGYPRNYLTVNNDDPTKVTGDDVKRAIRAQQNVVAEGCVLELFVDGERAQGVAHMIGADALQGVTVKLQAPSFVQPGDIEVYVNGIVRPIVVDGDSITLDDNGALQVPVANAASTVPTSPRAHGTNDVVRVNHQLVGVPQTEGDVAIVVLSKNGTGLAPTGRGSTFCYSAPLYVDVDGDGAFTPWLADTQNVKP